MKNNTQIWPASGWQTIANGNTTGYTHDITVPVSAGDAIYFIVNQNVDSNYDGTVWDPTITSLVAATFTPTRTATPTATRTNTPSATPHNGGQAPTPGVQQPSGQVPALCPQGVGW